MKKQSAGLLLYRQNDLDPEVFIVHPGGPFWAKKDTGCWSIPKGEFTPEEDPIHAAKREFKEETGFDVPPGAMIELGSVKQSSGKVVYAWALLGDCDPAQLHSNLCEIEWPPRSRQVQQFPEVDQGAWVTLPVAAKKLVKGQLPFLEKLAIKLGVQFDNSAEQATLF